MTTTSEAGKRMARLVADALELRDSGDPDWLSRVCGADLHAQTQVAAAVEDADCLPSVLQTRVVADPRIGTLLGSRYELTECLGAGAMGVVYQATDLELNRTVAIKVLHAALLDATSSRARFEQEGQAMAAVEHASIITIYDRGRTETGEAFLVMEHLDGVPLNEILEEFAQETPTPGSVEGSWLSDHFDIDHGHERSYVRIVVRWIADIASGLHAIHGAGVMHRDIKPSNVLVRRNGDPVLLDFGIALLGGGAGITRGDGSLGTPAYMPPETLGPKREFQATGDVYSLTASLYSLLTLAPPYRGTPTEVMAKLATREPRPAEKLHPGLPRDLRAILDKGLHRKPSGRYSTAAELEEDLRAFLDHRPVTARAIGPVARATRRLARSKTAMGATIAVLAMAIFLGAQTWNSHRAEQRYEEWSGIWKHVPPSFPFVGAKNRIFENKDHRAELATLLDEAVATADDPLPTFLYRAAFRWDHGDHKGAAEDIARIARYEDSAFTRSLLAAYEGRAGTPHEKSRVTLEQLPEPRTDRDRYILAFHMVAKFDGANALKLLANNEGKQPPFVEHLKLVPVDLFRTPQGADRYRQASRHYGAALQLEAQLGMRTAFTAHHISYALVHLKRYREALEVGEEGIALAPSMYTNRMNPATAAFRLGDGPLAREHLRFILEAKPWNRGAAELMVWTYVQEQDFQGAHGAIARNEAGIEDDREWWASENAGIVESYRALHMRATHADRTLDDGAVTAPVLDACRLARQHFDDAIDLGDKSRPSYVMAVIEALETGDDEALFRALVIEYGRDSNSSWRLAVIRDHLPFTLSEEGTGALHDLIKEILQELPGAGVHSQLGS